MPLDTRLFPKMWRYRIDLRCLRPNETDARFFVAVDAAEARAEIAIAKVDIR